MAGEGERGREREELTFHKFPGLCALPFLEEVEGDGGCGGGGVSLHHDGLVAWVYHTTLPGH